MSVPKLSKKFLKKWGYKDIDLPLCKAIQHELDGGVKIKRSGATVWLPNCTFILNTPGEAVKFAAALNKLRRPLRLIKKDLDTDWSLRVKERDAQTCALCHIKGPKTKKGKTTCDALTAHHWLKTKARAGMARWARPCGVTVHFAEHIHTLHENPCWLDLDKIYQYMLLIEGEKAIENTIQLSNTKPTEKLVRALWLKRMSKGGK